jgi:Zn-dependent protease with chaperone function
MPTDFHMRPTAPIPPKTPDAVRIARPVYPVQRSTGTAQRLERQSKPVDAPAPKMPVAAPLQSPAPLVPAPRLQHMEPPPVAAPAMMPIAPARPQFPRLRFSAIPITPTAHLAKGTRLWTVVGWIGGIAAFGAAIIGTAGMALGGLILAPILNYFREKKVRALLNGTSLRVGEHQLPEIHDCVAEFSGRLGLKEAPSVYIVEDNVANGFAAKIGRKDIVLLTDDVVWGALSAKNPRALGFVIAHELAHVALGHTRTFRSVMRTVVKPLGRLDELSADNVARALIDDDTVAFEGLKILAVGPQLSPYVEDDALIAQAYEYIGNKQAKKIEKTMSHPAIMRRIANLLE